MPPRVREIRIENLRTIRELTLPLSGLTVLIGENGGGKSSIIEAVELLRRVGAGTFEADFREIHGGPDLLVRNGASTMSLGITLDGPADAWVPRYSLTLSIARGQYSITSEKVERAPPRTSAPPITLLERGPSEAVVYQGGVIRAGAARVDPRRPFLTAAGLVDPDVTAVREALAALEVHAGFDVTPWWVARSQRRETSLRDRAPVNREERLSLLGSNLAAAYYTLKNEHPHHAQWSAALDWVRLGLGYGVEDVLLPSAGSGYVELMLKLRGLDAPVRSAALSNGQLSWLAFVAMARLGVGRPLLAFDEPELHLHPALLVRATQLLSEVSGRHPVLLATHSRRLLDALGERAADAAILCELLPETGTTRLRRFDRHALRDWLTEYDGLGQVLDAGYEQHVLAPVAPDPPTLPAAEPTHVP